MRAIRASGSVRDTHSSFDSLLPLRFRSKRMRSSAVGVAIPLSSAHPLQHLAVVLAGVATHDLAQGRVRLQG
jgi:hypothetical protein